MASGKFIAYYRVSTQQQGQSGLGLDAQQAAVHSYLNGGEWELMAEFTEVETGKGSNALDKRPKLKEAITVCKKHKATLIIAKLDRLARNVHFISGLIESGIDFKCADMPEANKVMLQMHAVMSEWERDVISKRTKEALAAAKAKGIKLGNPQNLSGYIETKKQNADRFAQGLLRTINGFKQDGLTQRSMVEELNKLGIKSARGGNWTLIQLQRVLIRLSKQKT